MKALHLYCVARNGRELSCPLSGLDGRQVFTIPHRDLALLVSPAPNRDYKFMKREEVVRYLFNHQALIEQVMTHHTVIPVKFGTRAADEAETRKILENGYPQLSVALNAMEGKIELDLVSQWKDLDAILRQIGEEPEIRRQRAAIVARPHQETTGERVRIGQMVKARLDQKREERAAEIVEALRPLARDVCPHALLDDRMILNAAFLVDRAEERKVGGALERLDERYGAAIDFRCVGPLPPYSFSTVEIKTFELETIDRARGLLALREDAGLAEIREAYRRLVQQCHPDRTFQHAEKASRDAAGRFEAMTEAYRLLREYRQAGSSFRAPDVRGAVAVRIRQWSQEPGSA